MAAQLYGYSPGLELKAEILHRPQLLGHREAQVVNGIRDQNRGLTSSCQIMLAVGTRAAVLKLFPSQWEQQD